MDKNKLILIAMILVLGLGGFMYKTQRDKASNLPESLVLQIQTPYAFATAPSAKNGAAFMVISNATKTNDTLINAWSAVSEHTEIHQNLIDPDDGTMMMRKIPTLEIAKKNQTILEPAGYHIMFINLKEPLEMGQTFPLTLSFEKGGDITVNVQIIAPGSKAEPPQEDE